ncbi:MAG: hypothetical protein SFW67_26950 [Myxococcaceae bacterium]|nr:hypothetical protein [Myxococcaceae bacterium]
MRCSSSTARVFVSREPHYVLHGEIEALPAPVQKLVSGHWTHHWFSPLQWATPLERLRAVERIVERWPDSDHLVLDEADGRLLLRGEARSWDEVRRVEQLREETSYGVEVDVRLLDAAPCADGGTTSRP